MVTHRYPLAKSVKLPKGRYVLVFNPDHLDELFRLAVVEKPVQRLLQSNAQSGYLLRLLPRCIVYEHSILIDDGKITVRLPKTSAEAQLIASLTEPEVWQLSDDEWEKIVDVAAGKLSFTGGTASEKTVFESSWKEASQKPSLFANIGAILAEGIAGIRYKNRTSEVHYPFPLFRSQFLSVFAGTKKEALNIILERLRKRYEGKRDTEQVEPALVVTPNLDHLRFLFEENDRGFQEIYEHAFLQTPDGYPPLMQFAKASLGYQPKELVTGIELFMQLINIIGSESLPYTIYLVGGFGNVPYKTRDYFVSIYPHLKDNFVGISTPPIGFLNNEEIMTAVVKDINAKKPDIIFAGMTMPVQERFVYELMKRKANFGIGFCIGRAIEMAAGYQKK